MTENEAPVGSTFDIHILENGFPACGIEFEQVEGGVVRVHVNTFGNVNSEGVAFLFALAIDALQQHVEKHNFEMDPFEGSADFEVSDEGPDIPF